MIQKWEENIREVQRTGEPKPITESNLPWNPSEVLRLLRDGEVDSEWGMSKEIGRILHMQSSTVCINLRRLVVEGYIVQLKKGVYRVKDDLDKEMRERRKEIRNTLMRVSVSAPSRPHHPVKEPEPKPYCGLEHCRLNRLERQPD